MISTFQALVVALIAVAPGAIYTFVYERHAGAYGVQLADRFVRFLVASAVFHALAAWPELAFLRAVVGEGWKEQVGWRIELIALVYIVLPFSVGSIVGWGAGRGSRWITWFVGSTRHPRAWDHLWSDGQQRIVRVTLTSGNHLGGVFEPPDSSASGYGEEPDIYLSRQLAVDPDDGSFVLDPDGLPVVYEPEVGLYVRANDADFWHVQEVTSRV